MIFKLISAFIAIVFSYIGVFKILPDFYWFQSFEAQDVLIKTISYQAGVFGATFLISFLLFYINDRVLNAISKRATIVKDSEPDRYPWIQKLKLIISTLLGPYQSSTDWVTHKIKIGIYLFVSLIIARIISNYWDDIFLYFFHDSFNVADPIFNLDISFFVFQLPVLSNFIFGLKFIIFSLLVYSLWSYLKKGFFPIIFSSTFSLLRVHIFGLLAIFFSIKIFESYLDRFDLLFNQNDVFFGASYTDIHVILTALKIVPFLWAFVAIVTVIFIIRPNVKLIASTIGLVALFQVVFLSIVPSVIQNYVVTPNEFNKEQPFISHNIQYTQKAYQLDTIQETPINYTKSLTSFNDASFKNTLNNIRLWNPEPLKSTLKQLQEIRLYYEFNNVDIDRYTINGTPQQVMLSARELDIAQLSQQAQTWVNQHLIYTHGYGLCLVPVNEFNSEGLPNLMIRDIPPVSQIDHKITQPAIYFGESTNHYVIANSHQKEFDYPKDTGNEYTHYKGSGGIQLDSFLKRLIYAVKLNDIKLLISQNIHSESRLIYDQNVHLIPRTIAPFITFDNDPYIVINENGRLVWLLDGYTASAYYPYATPYGRRINYIRNAVLATVDAYSGKTTFYIKDAADPIINAYAKLYPNLFKSMDDMPTGIKQHIRFPKDLFKIVTNIYNTFHMSDPQVFYNKEDLWTFPTETYDSDTGITMEPYYMYTNNPVTNALEYSIMIPLTPSNKNNLVAMLTASCEPDSFGQLNVYQFPKQETIYGPMQIESRIDQNTEISKDLTLWGQVGSRVIRGNLMVIPYDNTILYVEPIYLQATQSKLPELKRVIVALGDQVTMSESIDIGLSKLSQGNYTPTVDDAPIQQTSSNQAPLTKKIIQIYSKMKESLNQSNWKSFGDQFSQLDDLIETLKKEP